MRRWNTKKWDNYITYFFTARKFFKVVCCRLLTAADCRMGFWMRAHIQGVLNQYNVKWRLEVSVYGLVPLWSFEPRWTWIRMALCEFLSVLCLDCTCVSTSLWEIMEGVPASILQSAQNVKVKLLSIIRIFSTENYCLPTFRTPSPYPNNLNGSC